MVVDPPDVVVEVTVSPCPGPVVGTVELPGLVCEPVPLPEELPDVLPGAAVVLPGAVPDAPVDDVLPGAAADVAEVVEPEELVPLCPAAVDPGAAAAVVDPGVAAAVVDPEPLAAIVPLPGPPPGPLTLSVGAATVVSAAVVSTAIVSVA